MGIWAVAIPAIASAIGSYLSNQRKTGFDPSAADRAYRQLDNPAVYSTSNWMFPRLLPNPQSVASSKTNISPGPTNKPIAKARGGPVETGGDYLVGEQGPELFQPKQDGTIIPNEQTMMGQPGGGQGAEGMDPLIMALAMAITKALIEVLGQGGQGMDAGMMGGEGMGAGMPPMSGGMGGGMPMPGGSEMGSMMGGPPGRALGGPVRKGQTYRVGEQGPEGFAPTITQGAPAQTNNYQYPGEGYVGTTMDLFNKPGQLSPVAYHREQEQANQAQNQITQNFQGGLTGAGLDPNSPFGQSLQQAGVAATSKIRAESARDYSLAQETLKRQDIAAATNQYLQALQVIFGLQTNRAAAAGGQGYPQAAPIYPYSNYGQGIATLGNELGKYFDQSKGSSTSSVPESSKVPGK